MQATARINRKLVQRTIIFIAIALAVAGGAIWLLSKGGDPDTLYGPAKTAGDIAAIETTEGGGAQAVIIKPDGSIIRSPDYKPGANDEKLMWRGDGGRLFFISDRYNNEPHVFRWDPDRQTIERRTIDNRAKGTMNLTVPGEKDGSKTALMISGGTVVEIDPNTGQSTQVLPPHDKNASQAGATSEEGAKNEMSAIYGDIGSSFAVARWTKNKHFIIAVMNRDAGDQALVMQDITDPKSHPMPIAMAKHIGLDLNPITGAVIFTTQGYEIPDWATDEEKAAFIKNGRIVPPVAHAIFALNPDDIVPGKVKAPSIVAASRDDKVSFGDPKFAPNGSLFVVPVGPYVDEAIQVKGLTFFKPAATGNFDHQSMPGDFEAFTWSPDSLAIAALIRKPDGTSTLIVIDQSQKKVIDLTKGTGNFTEIAYSPQSAAPSAAP